MRAARLASMASSAAEDAPEERRRPRAAVLEELLAERQKSPSRRNSQTVLTELSGVVTQLKAYEASVDLLVIEARSVGATWNEIANALGVTTQTAHRRYSPQSLQAEVDRQNRIRRDARGELPLGEPVPRRRQG